MRVSSSQIVDGGPDAVVPDSGNGLSIWLTRTNLLGAREFVPTRIETFGGNCGSPHMAALGEGTAWRMIATWQCSNVPGSSGSFETHYRVFDPSGAPQGPDTRLQTRRNGMTLDIHAFPSVAAQIGRGFLLAGSRGVPEIGGGFKGYVQVISPQGSVVDDAVEWNSDRNEEENNPSVGVAGQEFVVAYERAGHAFAVREGGAEVDLGVGSQPVIAADARRTLAAFVRTDARDVVVYELSTSIRTEPAFRVASSTRAAYTPALAMDGAGGGALMWSRAEGPGARGPILAVRFDASGNVSGEYLVVARSTSFSYTPMFAHLGGDRFLLGWTEGSGSNLRLSTTVVELALAQP